MNKVITRIFGGLGNQLFCYAAARRLALVNNAELVIDDVTGFSRDYTYRRQYQLDHFNISCRKATPAERLEPGSRMRRFLKRTLNSHRPFEARSYIRQEGIAFDPRLLQAKPKGAVHIEGYWPSELYFKDVESVIRSDLRIKPPEDRTNLLIADKIRSNVSVALHVRFFDSPTVRGVSNLSPDFYRRAIDRMESVVPGAHYFLFSDQPDYARSCIPLPESRVTDIAHNLGDSNAYADLWLMTLSKHFIIANSTFSWWGAWLSESANKIVFAPKLDGGTPSASWGFDGLIPSEWNQC